MNAVRARGRLRAAPRVSPGNARSLRVASLIAALVLTALGGCSDDGGGSSAKPPTAEQLQAFVLSKGDLGRGYQAFASEETGSFELNPALGGDRHGFGRQNGWTSRYRRVAGDRPAPLTVVSAVDAFDDDSGAADLIAAIAKHQKTLAPSSGLEKVDAPVIGDESQLWGSPRSAGAAFRYYELTWRDGRLVGTLIASGVKGRPTVDDVLSLARKQAARIHRAK